MTPHHPRDPYRGRLPTVKEEPLRKRLVALSAEHPRYGYPQIAALLRREGWAVGKRQIQRFAPGRRAACRANEAEGDSARGFDGFADEGDTSEPCLDVGLHRGRHHARRGVEAVDDSG